MMLKKQLLITLLLIIGAVNAFSQLRTVGSDSERIAEYKKAIGLDTTVPDFDTNKIDAKVMGSRLANLLNYLLENYNQDTYELQIAQILGEQNESLQHLYYKIKKMKFANASKQGGIITILMNVWPDKNKAEVNQADIVFRFVDGVSDDRTTNDLFSYMSRYVKVQEALGVAPDDSDAIVANSVWDNWYLQVGGDMNLLFPEGHRKKDVFTKGKSFGINAAIGKWFSPEFGGRIKLTWNNGIFSNNQNTWLAPYGEPGQNHRDGGFITFLGDIQFNLHNLIGGYNQDRIWNLIVSPRFGGYLNIEKGYISGAHVLGVGAVNTFRISNRWRLFADVGYHFVSSINGVSSGKGHGANGFAEIGVGVEYDLSPRNSFYKIAQFHDPQSKDQVLNSFWDNWFIQAGIGMSLQNPYGTNFKYVFPNGSTYGINLGIGKWFSPMAGIRGGINWQNGIIINYHAAYLAPAEDSEGDPDKHSFGAIYADMFFNLHNIIGGYDESRKWNAIIYPRLGVAQNFSSSYKENPVLGLGTEQTYKLSNKIRLYADLTYQVVTGGFLDAKFETGRDGSSGWFDLNVGIQYEFGRNTWDKPVERRSPSHWEGGHNWPRFIVNTGASVIVAFGAKTTLKKAIKEERPDHSDNKSFPSGHASMAFAAARSIDKEFRKNCIWIPIAGYTAATAVGIERIANKHHHWYDVVAGAAIGIGSAELTWWLSDLVFGRGSNVAVGSSGNTVDVAIKM